MKKKKKPKVEKTTVTIESVIKQVIRMHRRAELEFDENHEDYGPDSRQFLWSKCRMETLEDILVLLNAKENL